MIIELYGLPGSGKTTFAKELGARVELPVLRMKHILERLRWVAVFVVHSPLKFFQSLFLVFQEAESFKEWYTLFMNGILDRFARYERALQNGGILDEGPIQNTLTFFHRRLSVPEMEKYLHTFPQPDVLIVCSAPFEERMKRQKERGRVARNEQWEIIAEKNFATAISVLQKSKLTMLDLNELGEGGVAVEIKRLQYDQLH